MRFTHKQNNISDEKIEQLSKGCRLSFPATKILVSRGEDTPEKVSRFLNPTLKDLFDPFLLNNLREVKDRIIEAVSLKKKILIFGDYDVDGISATAILHKYFSKKGADVSYFLPNRYEDGYGLTMETAQKVLDLYSPEFIITVDCGISGHKEVAFLKSKGVEVIVTDHHEIPETLPDCLVIDPKIAGQKYPFKELCGAGVALKIVQALGENLEEYLPICAIATVADIVELKSENRAIVVQGLKHIGKLPEGIKMMLRELKINELSSGDIAFKVAPKINAAGRMGDASIGLQLYISKDKKVLQESLMKLGEMNLMRQELCNRIYNDCISKLQGQNMSTSRCIILESSEWDSGLLGIVCARLTEEFNKPTFLFSNAGVLRGSVRSLNNINIHRVLSSCSSLLETFGGHSMAAGLTLKPENLDRFKQEVIQYLNNNFNEQDFIAVKEYDMELKPGEINLQFASELQRFEPFGCGNPRPVFKVEWKNTGFSAMKDYPQHLNIHISKDFSLLAFNQGHNKANFLFSERKTALVELQLNQFKGKTYLKGLVKNLDFSGCTTQAKDFIMANYIRQLAFNKREVKNPFTAYEDFDITAKTLLQSSKFGTLILVNTLESFYKIQPLVEEYGLQCHISQINDGYANNAVVIGLSGRKNLQNYNNFVFVEPVLHMDYLNNFALNIYLPKEHSIDKNLFKINTDREYFLNIYKKLKKDGERISVQNEYDYFQQFKKLNPDLKDFSYLQFTACILTFTELGFISIKTENTYQIIIEKTEKTPLNASNFYNRLNFITKTI